MGNKIAKKYSKPIRISSFLIGLVCGVIALFLPYWFVTAPVMFLVAVLGAHGEVPLCPILYGMEKHCSVFKLKRGLLTSPFAVIYLHLKLKIGGFRSIDKYRDHIYLCTACNRCGLADQRRVLKNSFVEHGAEPESLNSIRRSLSEYGNPYGSSEPRFAFVSEPTVGGSSTALFVGCTSCYRVPELAASALALLEASHIELSLIPDEGCCGFSLYMMGDIRKAREMAQKNIKMFREMGIKEMITLCPACHLAFETLYAEYPEFDIQVRHILEVLRPESKLFGLSMTLHDSCHLEKKVGKIARESFKGCRVQKSKEPCCGAPLLSYNTEVGIEIAHQITEGAISDYITSYCPSCYMILSRIEPEKVIDFYTLLRAPSADEVKRLKEWAENLYFQLHT